MQYPGAYLPPWLWSISTRATKEAHGDKLAARPARAGGLTTPTPTEIFDPYSQTDGLGEAGQPAGRDRFEPPAVQRFALMAPHNVNKQKAAVDKQRPALPQAPVLPPATASSTTGTRETSTSTGGGVGLFAGADRTRRGSDLGPAWIETDPTKFLSDAAVVAIAGDCRRFSDRWNLPLANASVNSPFGYRGAEFHTGLDFAAGCGTPVMSAAAGTVIEAGFSAYGGGNRIVIDHGNGLQTTYNHLETIAVQLNQSVGPGSPIAVAGSTGNSTGCHLHVEAVVNGQTVDPAS